MLSQAKHIYRVIFVLFFVFSSNFSKFYRTSGQSYFNFPSKSPTTFTFRLFFVTISKILSCQYIEDSCQNCCRANSIKNSIYSILRLKFQRENAQNEAYSTPNSKQQIPYTCPENEPFFYVLAYLRFPSIMKATWRGTFPCRRTRIAIFYKQVNSSIWLILFLIIL